MARDRENGCGDPLPIPDSNRKDFTLLNLNLLLDKLTLVEGNDDAWMLATELKYTHNKSSNEILRILLQRESLLSEAGKIDVLENAYHDENSTVCTQCLGLVRRDRLHIHNSKWCPANAGNTQSQSTDMDMDNDMDLSYI
uniref:C2HC zinc finger plants domain-containing protein n=1 Tax=Aplanochytrium stocchinoi TaxID=215587 RepID=A0A6S8A6G4_9STRA|mmetsp:Transcript_8606/g.10878  ORF Transcript_8606/g.10878 Transcript_8606/m.10878 type:complete len:140 (-) Transcript_8606:501-920(-)|eukprot:CAMPEP_0204828290 /NCGR_PEP_ID=MMETSP1346-20131115/5968_1 /ASSEMBLY_ACC=CAM_ASM_000771 /TAXON_ID=215587 /ORGANISM="Aplanochytrium stocchinoi, Strain GSBS06" /LENGTH=139 /DNA_ID=CAMNT_0051957225 /DNA_START=208 /DNA_END=627 /DNA_ORIENTATION=-